MAKVDTTALQRLKDAMQAAGQSADQFFIDCDKELAARLLTKAIKRTPVGIDPEIGEGANQVTKKVHDEYWKGYMGGTLRRGWTAKTEKEAEQSGRGVSVSAAVAKMPVQHVGAEYNIDVVNCVSYASYVEYGHRQTPGRFVPALGKTLKASWVNGQFMLTNSVNELSMQAEAVVRKKLQAYLRKYGLNGK